MRNDCRAVEPAPGFGLDDPKSKGSHARWTWVSHTGLVEDFQIELGQTHIDQDISIYCKAAIVIVAGFALTGYELRWNHEGDDSARPDVRRAISKTM
jgi:hypothetical protein